MSPIQQIVNLVKNSEKILILGHANPDGDAAGSVLSLARVLTKLGKNVSTAAADTLTNSVLNFLPEFGELKSGVPGLNDLVISLPLDGRADVELESSVVDGRMKIVIRPAGESYSSSDIEFEKGEADFDLIICCDTPELPQLGRIFESSPELFYDTPVVNIDHHASNVGFGKVDLVDTTASATTEILFRLVRAFESEFGKKLIDEDVATLLLVGIITDTGSFQNANTTPRSFEVAADLVELGGRQQEIINRIYKTKQLSTLKLWGRILSKINFDEERKIVWSTITADDLDSCEADENQSEGLIDELLSNAPGAEVVLLLKQSGDDVKGSIRTTTPAISASELAGGFGGGGHLQAAGFRISDKKISEVEEEVISKLRDQQKKRLGLTDQKSEELAAAEKRFEEKTKKIAGKKKRN